MKKIINVSRSSLLCSTLYLMLSRTKFENLISCPNVKVVYENLKINQDWVKRYNNFFGLTPNDKVSLTFPFLVIMPLQIRLFSIPEIKINPLGFLHLSNYIRRKKHIPVEVDLRAEVSLKQVRLVKKGVEICVEQLLYFENEIIWNCESRYLKLSRKYRKSEENNKDTKKRVFIPMEKSQMIINFSVSSEDAKKYASLSGDFNLIHISKLFAKLMGLPSPIIHGMWTVGKCLKHLSYANLEEVFFYHIFKGTIPIGAKGKIIVEAFDSKEQVEVYIEGNPKPCFQGLISNSEIELDLS